MHADYDRKPCTIGLPSSKVVARHFGEDQTTHCCQMAIFLSDYQSQTHNAPLVELISLLEYSSIKGHLWRQSKQK